jgi:predicted metal-dependent hydrolase
MRHCDDDPPAELLQAIDDFNRGDWFDSHESLEELWVGEEGEIRDFYQGVLQVAVALHHWRDGNFGGAVLLLEKGAGHLRRVRPVCQGIDVADLVAASNRLREELELLGPARMADLAPALIPRLRLVQIPAAEGEQQ